MPSARRWWERAAVVAWIVVAITACVAGTQLAAWSGTRLVAVMQALTPYLVLLLAPIAALALWRRWLGLATTTVAVGIMLLPLTAAVAFPGDQPAAAPGSVGLTIASANLLFTNDRVDAAADTLAEVEADVLVLSEYTSDHQAVFERHRLRDRYPHRIDRTGRGASGLAIWSRFPVAVGPPPDTFVASIDLSVDGPDGVVRIVGLHPPTPTGNFEAWRRDLATVEAIGRTESGPTAVIGDLNTTYWHPDFRTLLDVGFVDAHTALGRGFSTSWPTDWTIPPFVRLDHALTIGGLLATHVVDIDVPGSDHRGFVVTVAPTR